MSRRTIFGISMFACLIASLFLSNLQAQQLKSMCKAGVNRFETTGDALTYDHLMLLCITDLYRNQTEESRAGNRSNFYLFSADSSQVYYGILCEKDKGYEQYLPQKQNSRSFSFRKSAYIAEYVLNELDKGNVVSVASSGKRKFIVQSFNN